MLIRDTHAGNDDKVFNGHAASVHVLQKEGIL